jgi:acyl-coenzyme A synthetase/AMP-(fatty) acid ligase
MIYRFAILQDKSIPGSFGEAWIAAYCRKVSLVWSGFFIFNGSIAAWTIFFGSDVLWSIYNGGISYILMGTLFAGEYIIRKKVQKNMPKVVTFSELKNDSWDPSTVLAYNGAWGDKDHKTWGDFLRESAILRSKIESVGGDKWLVHSNDCWYFMLSLVALFQCKKEAVLTANLSPAYLAEIKGDSPFLTDQDFSGKEGMTNTFHLPSLVSEKGEAAVGEMPLIKGEESFITFWTSGSTGKPKPIRLRFVDFEVDTKYLLTQWENEFCSRKMCSTVSHHHIYGFLFGAILPFAAAIPFRRATIVAPEEVERLSDESYFLITVPAFLKRAVEIETPLSLKLKSPYILASGGFLFPDVAQKTAEIFGCWPLELYGSTEISGIAWRQQNNGPGWIPFGNAKLEVNGDGCLVVKSTYRQEYPEGFETNDLVKMLPNGQFILLGRLDSIVKIEEKRISLPEVEGRITESGLVDDVSVIALEDNRQYLAAALVFNAKGKEKFAGLEKNEINKFWREHLLKYFENVVIPKKWRYVEALPVNTQGKKKKEDIELLFSGEAEA